MYAVLSFSQLPMQMLPYLRHVKREQMSIGESVLAVKQGARHEETGCLETISFGCAVVAFRNENVGLDHLIFDVGAATRIQSESH